MLDLIKQAGKDNHAVVCFVGVGSAFAKKNSQCSLIISKNGKTMLVDVGANIPEELAKQEIAFNSFDYFHFTHSHSDHVGGLEQCLLMSRYVYKTKPKVVITGPYQTILWEHTLKGGCEYNESGLLRFSDFIEPIRPRWVREQPRELYEVFLEDMDLSLTLFRTKHIPDTASSWEQAFWSNGLVIDNRIVYTCDTKFDPELFAEVGCPNPELVFHDCQLFPNSVFGGGVHASYDELKTLPAALKNKTRLHHYGDNFDKFRPKDDGFMGFAEPWVIYS